jgi:hypothetical protein
MLLFAAVGLADQIEQLTLGNARIEMVAFVVLVLFSISGFVLIRHGHHKHTSPR